MHKIDVPGFPSDQRATFHHYYSLDLALKLSASVQTDHRFARLPDRFLDPFLFPLQVCREEPIPSFRCRLSCRNVSSQLSLRDEISRPLPPFAAFFECCHQSRRIQSRSTTDVANNLKNGSSPIEHGPEMQGQSNHLDNARQFLAERRRNSRSRKLEAYRILIRDLLEIEDGRQATGG
ncbi:hypothetical protein [Paraburkholderia hospita]|uniref:hypothetical protein n=1 Tax=Paraburkholderia hospita TaxID=169430 RepID=UPI0010566F6D|nr:hypothetical protein [Paraburkholderia hospita]